MDDWKPKNAIDKIAIAETFLLYRNTKKIIQQKTYYKIKGIKKDFEKNEKMTSHPYVKLQKARTYQLLLPTLNGKQFKREYEKIISNSYEEAIEAIDFYYPYIKGTKSYGALLGLYGLFLSYNRGDYKNALRYLEDAKDVYDDLSILDKTYCTILNYLSKVYVLTYQKTKDKRYLYQFRCLFEFVNNNEKSIKNTGFSLFRYYQDFGKHYT